MGVDAKIYLPANVRLKTLTEVVCRLLGAPIEKHILDNRSHPGAWFAHPAKGVVKMRSYKGIPEMAGISIKKIDYKLYGQHVIGFSYHFEFGGPRCGKNNGGCRGIMMRAWAVNIAVFRRLADFFGGVVDYCDCDSKENDYVVEAKDDSLNCPESDKPWQDLQHRIMAVAPLTQEEIDACEKVASYHESETDKVDRLAGGCRYTVIARRGGTQFCVFDHKADRRVQSPYTVGRVAKKAFWVESEVAEAHATRLNGGDQQ